MRHRLQHIGRHIKEVAQESIVVYWNLLKIIVPVMIVVEGAIRLGLVEVISNWCKPAMAFFGLPAEASIILATNLLVGLYGAAAALITLAPDLPLSVADMTILGGMILFGHSIPIEQIIVKKTGTSFLFSTLTRLLAMILYGWVFNLLYSGLSVLEQPAMILIATGTHIENPTWFDWIQSSVVGLFWIFWVLVTLITLLRILEISGITRWITKLLTPGLRLIGIGPNAAPLAMIGILLGLTFGGGLILREVQKGALKPKSIFLSMIFMGFCHSIIEDTLIVIAFGSHWSGVLVGRIVLSVLLILPISFWVSRMSDDTFNRYLYSPIRGSGK